jgi:hypothetical protein
MRESERSEEQGVFKRTLRDAPRFSDVQRRVVAVDFGTTGVERRTKNECTISWEEMCMI